MKQIFVNGIECVKNGKTKHGQQKYKEKNGDKIFTEGAKSRCGFDEKSWAMLLYFNGLPAYRIGNIIGVSHVTILNWLDNLTREIKKNTKLTDIKDIRDIELDELFHYLKKKKTNYTWLQPSIEVSMK